MAAFVERKLQHHYIFWRIVYLVICIFFIDEEERKQLMRGKNQDEKLNPSTGGSVNYGSDMGIKETVYTRSTQSKMAAPKMKVTQSWKNCSQSYIKVGWEDSKHNIVP